MSKQFSLFTLICLFLLGTSIECLLAAEVAVDSLGWTREVQKNAREKGWKIGPNVVYVKSATGEEDFKPDVAKGLPGKIPSAELEEYKEERDDVVPSPAPAESEAQRDGVSPVESLTAQLKKQQEARGAAPAASGAQRDGVSPVKLLIAQLQRQQEARGAAPAASGARKGRVIRVARSPERIGKVIDVASAPRRPVSAAGGVDFPGIPRNSSSGSLRSAPSVGDLRAIERPTSSTGSLFPRRPSSVFSVGESLGIPRTSSSDSLRSISSDGDFRRVESRNVVPPPAAGGGDRRAARRATVVPATGSKGAR